MKMLCTKMGALCVMTLLASSAFGLEIQVAPRTLVLSSPADQLTIHTDVPYDLAESVILEIGNKSIVDVSTWADDCGNLVVRCSKDAVEEAVGEFTDRFATVDVTLTVDGTWASEILRVRK